MPRQRQAKHYSSDLGQRTSIAIGKRSAQASAGQARRGATQCAAEPRHAAGIAETHTTLPCLAV